MNKRFEISCADGGPLTYVSEKWDAIRLAVAKSEETGYNYFILDTQAKIGAMELWQVTAKLVTPLARKRNI